ncbi:MAG: bifunctional pyr operon transcriptional regulator/uracil phosphoribosyltransferase PyrR [Acidobacteriota bacterium]
MTENPRSLMDAGKMNRTLDRIAAEIREKDCDNLAVVGIRTRGVHLAERLVAKLAATGEVDVGFGILDINLYRDDLSMVADHPVLRKTEIPFAIGDKRIVLVDDVLFTGRTVRAALDAIADLGRPRVVELAVLVDRGNRELPIRADYIGMSIPTGPDQWVKVLVAEEDGADRVELGEAEPAREGAS